jgi:methylmalonyl-CoA mutase N-terminal domain/subunit
VIRRNAAHGATARTSAAARAERPWTVRRSTALLSNAHYRRLVAAGDARLTVEFDLPTRHGYGSDAPIARGEVGRTGTAIDSLDDMRVLFGGIPLGSVSVSMAAGASAAAMLLLYHLVAEEQGVPAHRLTGALRTGPDPGGALAPGDLTPAVPLPGPSPLRLVADLLAYCRAELPRWTTDRLTWDDDPPGDPWQDASHALSAEHWQREGLAKHRAWRCQDRVNAALAPLRETAAGSANVLYPMKDALAAGATVGEVCGLLRDVWDVRVPSAAR